MRPEIVVVVGPFRNGAAGMIETKEQALVEQLVAHAAVDAPDIAVLHWSSRRNVVPLDLVILRPGKDGIRGQFGPVVGDNHAWLAPSLDKRRQFSRDTATRDRCVRDRRQAFARHVFDHIEHAEASAAGELIVDEIQRALAFASTRIGARVPTARRLAFRLRTERPSSR